MKISVAFTTFNRTDLLYDAVLPFILDERVAEIVIVDDHSDENIYNNIVWKYTGVEKIKIYRNGENMDCYRNKRQAVKRSTSDWVALLDSDNIFTKEFVDALFTQFPWNISWAYAPEFARPHFNFTELRGVAISKNNIQSVINNGNCSTMLNAMNYFVNRDEFLRLWDGSIDPVTSDSLYHNYNWLKGGNTIYVTPGLQYEHRVNNHGNEEISHYLKNIKRTPVGFHNDILRKLREMK